MRLLSVLALAALLACPATSSSTDTAADEAAIRGVIDAWNQALSGQQDSVISTLYADDAVLMPPAMARVRGRAAIRGFYAALWPLHASLTLTSVSIRVSGDWAIEEGDWDWTSPGPTGEQRDHGKYLRTWRRSDTSWQTVHEIWNSDQAPTPAREK